MSASVDFIPLVYICVFDMKLFDVFSDKSEAEFSLKAEVCKSVAIG